jgi:MFS family permease
MKIKVNKVIKYLILSDISFWSAWGLINPIFAIFIVDNIQGGSIFIVGIAVAIYWISKSALAIPIGIFIDSLPSEKDDYFFLVLGLFIASLVLFGYIFAKLPWHIFILQAIYGGGVAISVSSWRAIFTRHIDKGKEATEWSIEDASFGMGVGIAGAVGGWTVSIYGFYVVFLGAGIIGLFATAILFFLRHEISGVFDNGLKINFRKIFKKENT